MKSELTVTNSQIVPVARTESNLEVIKEFLLAGGEGVELTDKQKHLLDRWEFADEKIRENMGKLSRTDIAKLLVYKFGVTLRTAKADMLHAEKIFSSSNPINKAYHIGIRIEFLEKQILKAANEKDYKAVASLEKTLAKYFEIYPDITPVEVPKKLIFSFDVEKLLTKVVDVSKAEDLIDKQLEKNKLMASLAVDIEEEEGFENE